MIARYANDPHWMRSVAEDIFIGLILLIGAPVLLWQFLEGWFLKRCNRGKHWYRDLRTDRYGRVVEERCRICKQWRWFSQGIERHDQPPWY
jgi:hypothetical protein